MNIDIVVWIVLAILAVGVAAYFIIRHKRGANKSIAQSSADEVEPEKPQSVVLEIHSAKHVVLGMPKLTDNQRLRVERHHRRSVKHGKVAE